MIENDFSLKYGCDFLSSLEALSIQGADSYQYF